MPATALPLLCIGSLTIQPPVALAPMASVTNSPFRRLCRRRGAGIVFTEMLAARTIVQGHSRTALRMHREEEERPVGYQLAGSDPAILAEAARRVEDHGADLLDLNMGCPARKIVRRHGGSALMREPDRAATLVATLVRHVSIPVTVKMRSGWDSRERNAVSLARRLRDAGAAAVTIHARTREDGHGGPADWTLLAEAVRSAGLPVIGCGGIGSAQDALRMLRETGCGGVMVARAALGNPWVFEEIRAGIAGRPHPTIPPADRWRDIREHLDATIDWCGEALAVRLWRRYGPWYVAGRPGAAVAREKLCRAGSRGEILNLLQPFFGERRGSMPDG